MRALLAPPATPPRPVSGPKTRSLEMTSTEGSPTPVEAAPPPVSSVPLIIHFERGSAKILPASYSQLDKLNQVLATLKSGTRIGVVGHTDAAGSDEYNFRLSRERAVEVGAYLASHSIDPARLYFQGLGKTHPLRPDDLMNEDNRSVEIQWLKTGTD